MKKIFEIFWANFERGGFEDLIFRLILFHQSLPGIVKIPPISPLLMKDIKLYCDIEMLKLMVIFMKYDSWSYRFISDFGGVG